MSPLSNPYVTDNTTFINPIGLAFTILMGLLMLILPRRFAAVPILATICYMTMGMRFIIGGLNFTMIRIVLVFCWARLAMRGELKRFVPNEIDKAIIWFTIASIITHTFLLGSDGLKYKLGQGYDALGYYFFFRILIRDWDDIVQMFQAAAVLMVPLALEMINEKLTLHNMFSMFGGVGSGVWVRDGTARAQGPFGHPILSGTFGATMAPFMVGLWFQKKRLAAAIGLLAALAITVCSGSSGPVMALGFGVLALGAWILRRNMQFVRRAMVVGLLVLHFSMKAPVWFLLARVSVFDASTGWHRAFLIDRCIANFSDWWLYGTTNYGNWGYYLFDRTNHYICLATDGGLVTLVLFFVLLTRCYRAIGVGVHDLEGKGDRNAAWLVWSLGGALVVHCASFISVTYFDQNMMNWYLLLALIASARQAWMNSKDVPEPESSAELETPIPDSVAEKWLAIRGLRAV